MHGKDVHAHTSSDSLKLLLPSSELLKGIIISTIKVQHV